MGCGNGACSVITITLTSAFYSAPSRQKAKFEFVLVFESRRQPRTHADVCAFCRRTDQLSSWAVRVFNFRPADSCIPASLACSTSDRSPAAGRCCTPAAMLHASCVSWWRIALSVKPRARTYRATNLCSALALVVGPSRRYLHQETRNRCVIFRRRENIKQNMNMVSVSEQNGAIASLRILLSTLLKTEIFTTDHF